jgi:hypothetical protein
MKMNKQLTKKTIGIAASAALMASALSATAFAGPPKGPKPSIAVVNVCDVVYDDTTGAPLLKVDTTITDTKYPTGLTPQLIADDPATGAKGIEFTSVLGIGSNAGGGKKPSEPKWYVAEMGRTGDSIPTGDIEESVTFTSYFSLCDDPRTKEANAANSLVTVKIVGGHKEEGWTSYCSDVDTDGDGTPDVFSNTKIGHLGLCAD